MAATAAQKRRYAHSVLSGELLKKEAYVKHINPHVANPSVAAWRLEHTKSMVAILGEVNSELNEAKDVEKKESALRHKTLALADELLSNATDLSQQDKLKTLVQVSKLLDTFSKATAKHTKTEAETTDNYCTIENNHRPDFLSGVIL